MTTPVFNNRSIEMPVLSAKGDQGNSHTLDDIEANIGSTEDLLDPSKSVCGVYLCINAKMNQCTYNVSTECFLNLCDHHTLYKINLDS